MGSVIGHSYQYGEQWSYLQVWWIPGIKYAKRMLKVSMVRILQVLTDKN